MDIENIETSPEPSRPIRVAYLVMGLLFLGIVGIATIVSTGAIPWSSARYLWPGLLVTVGLVGLGASVATKGRSRERQRAL